MISRRHFVISGATTAALSSVARASLRVMVPEGGTFTATAVTQVFGEGQKLTALVLEYPVAITGSALSTADFSVKDRTITRVFTGETPSLNSHAPSGRYVILELSPDDKTALLISSPVGGGPSSRQPSNGTHGAGDPGVAGNGSNRGGMGPGGLKPGGMGPGGPPGGFPSPTLKKAEASVTQLRPLHGLHGATIAPPPSAVATTHTNNLIVDEFRQLTFQITEGGKPLSYNLFVPRHYDKAKRYPLVLFVHDAGTLSTNPLVTLAQGLGAVVWASAQEQAKRECFVLAPQFSTVAAGEKSGPGSPTDMILALIQGLTRQYSIDTDRLYATGQSMGAMLSIAMNIAHPGFFAATFLVAGQWDAEQARPLAKDKLWIVVSQGDERAYPGENAMAAEWEEEGAHISRAVWNGRADAAEFAADVKAMRSKGTPINYAALQKGTVVPPGQRDDPGANHINTWRIAYTIEGIRAWLFEQRKEQS